MAQLNSIRDYLQAVRQPQYGVDTALLAQSLKKPVDRMTKTQEALNTNLGYFPDAGQFGGPATLPIDPGPPEPPILTGNYPTPPPTFQPGPDVQVNWHGTGSVPYWNQPPASTAGIGTSGGISFGSGGRLQGGVNGPQGSVYGIDPNTGQPIYNVTGSPRPGFFDSKTGKFVEFGASAGLNALLPGSGTVARIIFDAIRKHNTAKNTGTDLSGGPNRPPPTGPVQAPPVMPSGATLFGYNPAQGGGTQRYNYGTGQMTSTPSLNPLYNTGSGWNPVSGASSDIRWAPNSGTGNFVADQTTKSYLLGGGSHGTPNRQVAPDSGRDRFSTGTGFMGQINPDTGLLERVRTPTVAPMTAGQLNAGVALTANPNSAPAFNAGLMNQPGYQSYMQRLAQLRSRGG